MTRTHLPPLAATETDRALRVSLCGRFGVHLSEEATCRDCRRLQARQAASTARDTVDWRDAVETVLRALAGPPVEAPPPLIPTTWREMTCRRGLLSEDQDSVRLEPLRVTPAAWLEAGCPSHVVRCRCPVCLAEEENAARLIRWQEEQGLRPHRRWDCEFGSRDAALTFLVRWRRDGASTRSSTGTVTATLTEAARLGTRVQTTQVVRESLEERRAGWAADLERFLQRAFAEEQARRGLDTETCIAIVLSTVDRDGPTVEQWAWRTQLTMRAVQALVAHGYRHFEAQLAAEDYAPQPRAKKRLGALVKRYRRAG